MKYTQKSIDLVEDVWSYLENNYKGSEITMELLLYEINKKADTENTLKQSIKYLWNNYDFFDIEYKNYCINYIYNNFNIKVK